MSSTRNGEAVEVLCNVCHARPGDKTCARCGIRRYCSRGMDHQSQYEMDRIQTIVVKNVFLII